MQTQRTATEDTDCVAVHGEDSLARRQGSAGQAVKIVMKPFQFQASEAQRCNVVEDYADETPLTTTLSKLTMPPFEILTLR